MMEVVEHACYKCGQNFSDNATVVSHCCPELRPAPSHKVQLDSFRCSQCIQSFSKPAALKKHFKTNHRVQDTQGPFPCCEQGCQFSSADRQENQSHLMSVHGLNLIACTSRSCKMSFLTQEEMESHRRSHMPFGCFHCQVVSQNVKDFRTHMLKHKHLENLRPGSQAESPAGRQPGTAVEEGSSTPSGALPAPSAAFLSDGSEDIYRTHVCPKCRRCFKMRSHLQEHLRLHFPDPSLQCPTCGRFFTSKSKLRVHRLREAGEKLHRCSCCDYSAVERNAVRRHVASVHPEEAEELVSRLSFLCPTCSLSFHHSRALKAHMKTHILSDGASMACFQKGCSFQSSQCKDLIRHAAEEHGVKAAECRHHACSAVFKCEADMEDHYRTHLAYHCSECDFSCSNKSVFLQHRRLGHTGKQKLCCDFCSFVTFNSVEFEHHVGRLHANEKIHRCSQCSYVTSHKRGLKRHVLMHSGEKPHKCSLCEFRCRDESYLSKHMLIHADDKNFMCAECGYVTKWKHYLAVHMRKHAGDLRYSCDQCSYRCHRMDQLKSHKLRHQAKTLMCEICAYACKRKYELRNHMLTKHSGEEKKLAAYKCKYCSYTTCYRQALQNHENCKHTKLKEFHCALCVYSSYSSISLFLHKRKAHGYIPGDTTWLENYAAKEKERNSAEFMEDFYSKSSVGHEQSEQPASATQQNQSGNNPCTESYAASQANHSVFDFVSQEVGHEAVSERSVSSPEQYCTLVLTTLTTAEDQNAALHNEEENCKITPPLKFTAPDSSQETFDPSTPTSSLEEENVEMQEGPCDQSDIEDAREPQTNPSQSVESVDDPNQAPEGENNVATIGSGFPTQENHLSDSEVRLKALRKHDKTQAEAMVLEGRVQMLAVPSEDVYRCEKCSYVTSKETALENHRRALCQSRIKGHECQSCGEQFKQRRGLDYHLRKKHSTLLLHTKTFVGISNVLLTSAENSAAAQGESRQVQTGTSSDQMELRSSAERMSTEMKRQQQEGYTSHTTTVSERRASEIQANRFMDIKIQKKILTKRPKLSQSKTLYVKNDGKFKCMVCSFSSAKLPVVKKHLLTCRETFGHIISETVNEGSQKVKSFEDHADKLDEGPSGEHQLSGCPNYAYNQKRAVDNHEKKGCMKPDELQCPMCCFSVKSKRSLSRHILSDHKEEKLQDPGQKRLHCQQCTFSCKQQRRMEQHTSRKHKEAQLHRCSYCSFSTSRRYRLEEHESLHTGVGRHSCDACDKTFGAVTKLRQHKIRIHDKQPTHFCPLCDFAGYAPDDIRRHNRRCHSGELQHVCSHCGARFSSEIALRNHCKRVHLLQFCFSCKKCDFTCNSEVTLKHHQQSRHPEVKCATCQEVFQTKERLDIHQRSHLAHPCQLCPFAAKTRQLLAQHLLNEHEGGSSEDKPLRCSTCEFACRHQLVFEQHLRSHGSKRMYKCTDCMYATRNKQKITWHIRIHTGERPYSCEQCSYTCSDPSRLKLHMRVHQEEKKYLCPDCGYKCKWATQLKYHMTKHTGEKPYACDECEYRTNRADALRAHRDTQHCDARPYVCEKCGKAFKTSFILKTHQKKHTDDRAYTCGLCQKSFRWPAGLRHHFLSHTKQQPFSCRHCSYRAKQRFQVVKHLQRHHPEESGELGVLRDSEGGILTLKEALQGALPTGDIQGSVNEQPAPNSGKDDVSEEVVANQHSETQ
ncbi:zinc finger protein 142 [Girardinichthys multiradiatus]|uniref:zinc finger protein 142 n=1 Tax=Girardinichthys multiradiatus TaxID=208333 RepID=UPI001FAD8E50|nr:zinc finger protein 142 [Girardinichthys multiradiatus]